MKIFWLKASVLHEQLLSSSYTQLYAYVLTLYTEQFIINYFGQKLTSFFKLFFRDFSLSANLVYNLGMFSNLELRSSSTKLLT